MDDISQVHLAAQFGIYLRYISEDGEWLPEEAVGGLRDPLIPVHSDVLKAARSYRQHFDVDGLISIIDSLRDFNDRGLCRGLCTIWCACHLAGKDELYESLLVQISLWDGAQRSLSDVVSIDDRETRLGDLFNQFVEITLYTQNSQFLGAPTFELKQEYAGQIHPSTPSMMVAGYFTEDDFETFLNRFKSGGLIILTDAKHMCTLQKVISNKVTVYLFYDPNNLEGAKKFTDIHPLFLYISEILSNSLAIQFLSQEAADSFVSLQRKYNERAHPRWLYGSGLMLVARYTPEKLPYLLAMVKASDNVDPLITEMCEVQPLISEHNAPVDLAKIVKSKELQQVVKAFILYREAQSSRRQLSRHGQRQVETFFQNCLRERMLTRKVMIRHANAARKGGFFSRRSGGGPGSRDEVFVKLGILSQ